MEKETLGLSDLLNVAGVAVLRGDKHFSDKIKSLINEKVRIEVEPEDMRYIERMYMH